MKRILKWLSIIILSFFILLIFLVVVFQNKIESAALSQLDLLTNHQLSYTSANINYIRSFPSITLDLTDPKLYDLDYNEAIQLEQFQVKMNLLKSLFSNPVISRLVVKNGSVTLKERNQKWNVVDLITNESNQSSQSKLITIDELIVENFNVIFDRGSADQIVQLTLRSADMRMSHHNNKLNIEAQGLIQFDYVINSGDAQLVEIFDTFQTTLDYNIQTKHLEISNTQLDHGLTAQGWFNANTSERDLQLKVENLDASIFNTWLANNAKVKSEAVELEGDFSGIVSMDRIADIAYTFYLDELGILHNKAKVTNLNSTMTGDQHTFSIQKFECELDEEDITGSISYHIEQEKILELNLGGNVPLKPLYLFSSDEKFSEIEGHLNIERFTISDYPLNSTANILQSIDLSVTPVDIRLITNEDHSIEIGKGHLNIKNQELLIDDVLMTVGKSSLTLNGTYAPRDKQFIQLKTSSDFLDTDDILPFIASDTSTSNSNILEENHVFLELKAKSIKSKDLSFKDVIFQINSIDNAMHIDAKGKAFGGVIDSEGKLTHNGEHYHLPYKHLKGDVNTICSFDMFYDEKWQVQQQRTKGVIGASISNGQIKDLALMSQFSKFVNIKDLNNIKFTELNNYLEIQGKNLYVPTMFIQSNEANFTLSGYHSTENVQLFFLKVNAGQILTNKFKKHDPNYSPKPAKRNGWFNMHYVISGTGEEYSYERDRSRVKAAFENGLERKDRIYRQLVREFGPVEELIIQHSE